MHAFDVIPDAAIDPKTGRPRFGSYRGALASIDLSAVTGGTLRRIVRRKRWVYMGFATEDVYVALAIVRLGYVANTFSYVFDKRAMRMLASRSAIGPMLACKVGSSGGEGCLADFRFAGTHARIERALGASAYQVDAKFGDLEIRASADTKGAPPAITAIANVGRSQRYVNATEKRAPLTGKGEVIVAGTRHSLDGSFAGYDYTHGLLSRHTSWRWAFLLGRAKSGEKIAMNIVQGFVGEPECAVWIDGEVYPLAEGRFAFDAANPMREWRVSTADGAVDLTFTPGGMHSEDKNLGLVASRFVQPAGVYKGTIRAGGKTLVLESVLGVTEDQDVKW